MCWIIVHLWLNKNEYEYLYDCIFLEATHPRETSPQYCTEEFKGSHYLVPHYIPERRGVSLSKSRMAKKIKNLYEILLNQTEIRLYLPFSNWFQFDSIRFRKDFSVHSSYMRMRWLRKWTTWIIQQNTHFIRIYRQTRHYFNCTIIQLRKKAIIFMV